MSLVKKSVLSIILLICILFLTPVKAGASVYNWSEEYAEETYINIEGTCIYYESGTSDEDTRKGILAWTLCPESVRVKLVSLGCRIYLSNSSVTDTNTNGLSSSAGFLAGSSTGKFYGISREPYILVMTQSADVTGTILHEIGHILDNSIARLQNNAVSEESEVISSDSEWLCLYEEYCDLLSAEDANTARGADEAFAVAFRLSFESPEWTCKNFPEIYEYVINAVNIYAAQ